MNKSPGKPNKDTLLPSSQDLKSTQDKKKNYFPLDSKRISSNEKSSPGPGSYSPPHTESSPKISFPKALRNQNTLKEKTPGPSDYQIPSLISNGPKYSMRIRDPKPSLSPRPGPGSYDPLHDTSRERFPSVRIGRSKRSFITESSSGPGPSSYSVDLSTLSGPKWKFTTALRTTFNCSAGPGPGSYKLPSSSSGIAYTISLSKKTMKRSDTPGPGAYSPIRQDSSPSAILGTSERETKAVVGTPGPGTYEVKVEKNKQSSIFGSSKRGDVKRFQSPGPGNYEIPSCVGRGPRFSIRSRLPLLRKLVTPGPGEYAVDVDAVLEREPKWTIPRTGRESSPNGI